MSRHLLIAGTGRAGTSFLVRYLTQIGLDTHLSRLGPDAIWDDTANAGLEDLPLGRSGDLPYIIKSPWSFQIVHDVLARGTMGFDAVILPMRDLTEAAASRAIVERQRLHETTPLLADSDTIWEQQGITPGGIVFSLNPIDQARLLAVGFHQLVEQLVRADIPLILLSFPRLIEDPDYLYGKLASVLPETVTVETARAAHAATAEPSKVRVGRESQKSAEGFAMGGPGSARLEQAALRRSLADALRETETAQTELANTRDARRGGGRVYRDRGGAGQRGPAGKGATGGTATRSRNNRGGRAATRRGTRGAGSDPRIASDVPATLFAATEATSVWPLTLS